jgi:hypothetical protein
VLSQTARILQCAKVLVGIRLIRHEKMVRLSTPPYEAAGLDAAVPRLGR